MHLSLHSPGFFFIRSSPLTSFLFRAQNFLIISAKMRDSLSRTEYTIQLVFLSRIRKLSWVLTPIGESYLRSIVWLFLIPIAFQIWSSLLFISTFLFLACWSLINPEEYSVEFYNLWFQTFNIRRSIIEMIWLIIEKSWKNYTRHDILAYHLLLIHIRMIEYLYV